METSIALQSLSAALRSSVTSRMSSSGTAMVWNRPPLNQGAIKSTPNRPPPFMAKQVAEVLPQALGGEVAVVDEAVEQLAGQQAHVFAYSRTGTG